MFHEFKGWVPKLMPNGEMIRIPWHMWVRGNPDGTTLRDPRLERAAEYIRQWNRNLVLADIVWSERDINEIAKIAKAVFDGDNSTGDTEAGSGIRVHNCDDSRKRLCVSDGNV